MAIPFTTIKQRNPRNTDEYLYYLRAVSSGEVEMEEIIEKLEMISTVSDADIVGVNRGEANMLAQGLGDGKIVRLGEIGDFRLTFQTKACKSEEEVTSKAILGARVVFNPGYLIKRKLRTLTFRKR